MERFFELARVEAPRGSVRAGFVGMITGNSFMKREFGAPLVEKFLPSVDLQLVIDASGAYIPGPYPHRHPVWSCPITGVIDLAGPDGIRGEPTQPAEPVRGEVWTSITLLADNPGEQDDFIRANDISRTELSTHPMTLGIGRGLTRNLESSAVDMVSHVAVDLGRTTHTGEDEAFTVPRGVERTLAVKDQFVGLVQGDIVRDWSLEYDTVVMFPYKKSDGMRVDRLEPAVRRMLWPRRTTLKARVDYGQTPAQRGLQWFEHSMFFPKRFLTKLSIAWGEVATHNHFVLDRGGHVFKQTAPVISCPRRRLSTSTWRCSAS